MSALPASRLCVRCGDPVNRGPLCELCQPGEVPPIDPGRWDRAVFDELDALCWKATQKPRGDFRQSELDKLVGEWKAAGSPKPKPFAGQIKRGAVLHERPEKCPRCGGSHLKSNGFTAGLRRWLCFGCYRAFTHSS